jgi:uncharacterized protein
MDIKLLNYKGIPLYYTAKEKNLPTVIVFHGFTSSSLRQEERTGILSKLYQNGFCVVAVDAVKHGVRVGAEEFLMMESQKQEEMMFEIVEETADEINHILKFIKDSGIGDSTRVGVTGISMGGFITFRAAILTDELKAFAPMVSSPYFEEFAKYALKKNGIENFQEYEEKFKKIMKLEPLKNKERFLDKNLFIIAGELDNTVPEEFSKKGYKELKEVYEKNGCHKMIKYKSYPAAHCENEEMIKDMIEWFKEVL